MNRWSFGCVVALARLVSACSSPADDVNDAPTLTFVVKNESGVDLSMDPGWIDIDGGSVNRTLWSATELGTYDGGPCNNDINDYGGLPPPTPDVAAGERFVFGWKENAFVAPGAVEGSLEGQYCVNIKRVPTGTHTFTACARQSGVECVVPGQFPPLEPQPACLKLTVALSDDDLSRDLVFSPETLPAQNCLMGTEQHQ